MIEVTNLVKDYGNHHAVKGISFSPIKGPEGNIEYLGLLSAGAGEPYAGDLAGLVDRSHRELGGGERP